MLRNHLERFLRDEDGGYTIWALTWFMLYVGIGGLAVDMTDAFRNQSMLQATADSAALAGIASPLTNEADVDSWAMVYANYNMQPVVHGNVLTSTDVDIGTWNFVARTFTPGGANPNAVHAITRRDTTNANPLATNFLRIVGLASWDVSAEGVAAKGVNACFNNGIIAGGSLDVKTHIHFIDDICLIGHEQFWFRNNDTTFEVGVYVGAGCNEDEKKCIGPGNQVNKNDDFQIAFDMANGGNFQDQTMPSNAEKVHLYIDAVLDLGENYTSFDTFVTDYNGLFVDYSGYAYLADDDNAPGYQFVTALPDPLVPHTVYELDCDNSGYVLPEGTYDRVAVIADCPISFATGADYTVTHSLLATTYSSQGRASIHGSANIDLGTAGCGGGNEMYSLGDINFASDGQFANLRILAQGDVHFAASSDSPNGTNIEATGDVFLASGSSDASVYGLCGDFPPNGAQSLSIALVH